MTCRQRSRWLSRHSTRVCQPLPTSSFSCEIKVDAKKEAVRWSAVKTAGEAEGVTWGPVSGSVDMAPVLPVLLLMVRLVAHWCCLSVWDLLLFYLSGFERQRISTALEPVMSPSIAISFPIRPCRVRDSRKAIQAVFHGSSTFGLCIVSHVKFLQWWFTVVPRACGVQWLASRVCQPRCFP